MAKTKKEKLGNHSNSKITKSKKEILMIPSLTQCNSYVIIYQFQVSKSKMEESSRFPH